MKIMEDEVYEAAERRKAYAFAYMQKVGIDREIAREMSNICTTFWLNGVEYGRGNDIFIK